MKIIVLLFGLIAVMASSCIANCSESVIVNIPDATFKTSFIATEGLDGNNDSKINFSEATASAGTIDGLNRNISHRNGSTTFMNFFVCINPTNAGTIAANQTICSGSIPATISNSTLPSGQSGTLEYKWQSSTDAAFTAPVEIINNAASYTPTSSLIADTWYRRLVKVTCENTWIESNAVKITVSPPSVGGAVSGGSAICYGSNSGLLSLTGETGTVTKWQSGVLVSGSWSYSDIANTNTTYTSGPLTQNTRFRAFVKSGPCSQAISTSTLVTVNPLSVGGTVATDQTICSGSTPASLTLSGHTGSVVRWEKSTDAAFTSPTTIAVTSLTLTGVNIGDLYSDTYFRAVVKSGSCSEANSGYVLISVDPNTVGGTVSGTSPVCSGNTSGLLSLTGYTGTVQKWQSAVSPFTAWTDIPNTTDTYESGALSETTRFRAVVKSGACLALNSVSKQIVVRPNPTFASGTVSPSNCYGDDVLFTASGLLPGINNTFYSTVTYGSTILQVTRNVTSDALGNVSYTGSGFSPDNYTYELDSITVSGCTTNFTGLVSDFVVHPLPTASISGSTTVCTGTTPQPEITFTGADGTSPYSFTYTINSGGNLIAVSAGNTVSLPQPTVSPGDFVYNLVGVADSYGCSQLQTGTATITVEPVSVGGSVTGGTTICSGNNSGVLTLSGYTGTITKWQYSTDGLVWTDIAHTGITYTSDVLTESTHFRAVVKSGVCSEASSAYTTVTVNYPVAVASVHIRCSGNPDHSIAYHAFPHNGGIPDYQWYKNGFPVGTNSPDYINHAVVGDLVYVVMQSSLTCVVAVQSEGMCTVSP